MTSLGKLRRKLLTDPEVKAEYDRLGPIFAVVGEMIEARQAAGLTQMEIATRMGASQSVVARLENVRHMPSFERLARYAATIGRRLEIHLVPNSAEHGASQAWQEPGLAPPGPSCQKRERGLTLDSAKAPEQPH
jgi:transcriptional regulator with XRE-family HTH domain